ncbi:hypothetical protein [Streptomyces sp. bgisy034]|uniref:hypothetical protein n=1 Tax=Streptomyces sp. bgisy034 TaxID=3413774 RepID=UPI003EBF87B6
MRIQNIANKIESLGGTCRLSAHLRKDNRHIVRLTGELGRYNVEAVDYNSPSSLATDADVSVVLYKREDDKDEWLFLRTIGSLEQLAPKHAKGVV